jgi:hypothetical protein
MFYRIITLIFAATVLSAFAAPRTWKSLDGTRTFQGEFVKRDATSVTLCGDNGREVIVELTKLHPDDQKWLDDMSQLAIPVDPKAFFDNLTFSDTRDSTMAKLKASKLVEMTTSETFVGRSGLNGIFRTRKKVGGLDAFLYFDWSPGGTLTELTLQTETVPPGDYKTRLEPSWQEFIELLAALYGNPVQKGPMAAPDSLADGSFMPSHLWRLDGDGSIFLGTARDGCLYQLVVRFTKKKAQLVEIP